jgi:hypothetical protein
MKRKHLILLISYLFFGLFAYAAIAKLIDFGTFRAALGELQAFGKFSLLLSLSIPAAEILTAVALLIPVSRLAGFYASAVLMAVFTIYVLVLLLSREPISCECGGLLEQLDLITHLWFNIGFLALGLIGLLLCRSEKNKFVHR